MRSSLQSPSPTLIPEPSLTSPSLYGGHGSGLNLKLMLMRLENSLGHQHLAQEILLFSQSHAVPSGGKFHGPEVATRPIVFLVGYDGSAKSQGALDIALYMAHQTRLVKPREVVVHVVYIIEAAQANTIAKADVILEQARCLASEWSGTLNTHLRIGQVATELGHAAMELNAEVMLLGCHTAQHPLVHQLAAQAPCSILGIPMAGEP